MLTNLKNQLYFNFMQIEQKDLEFLIELGKKMNEQDPRGTQNPMFIIKQKVKVYGENGYGFDEKERDIENTDDMCEDCQVLLDNDEELPDDCDHCGSDCFRWFTWQDQAVEDTSSFFTAEAAQRHIDLNSYHYNQPFTYATGTWRNEEMQRVQNILSKLGGMENNVTYK